MYQIQDKVIGYVVAEFETLKEAKEELKHLGKKEFVIVKVKEKKRSTHLNAKPRLFRTN